MCLTNYYPLKMPVFLQYNYLFYFLFLGGGYDVLLNNVPPNVSLQPRNSNVVSDSQLSPSFTQSLIQQQLSPNQRSPFSPQSTIGIYNDFRKILKANDTNFLFYKITQAISNLVLLDKDFHLNNNNN